MALEIMDSMFKPEQYGGVYLGAFFYIFSLTLPHSIAANLAFPHKASVLAIYAHPAVCNSQHVLTPQCMWVVACCDASMSCHSKVRVVRKRPI